MTSNDLSQRMAHYTPGQITWPALGTGDKCTSCRFFARQSGAKGICSLIKKQQINAAQAKKLTKQFDGSAAIRCSMFEAAQ